MSKPSTFRLFEVTFLLENWKLVCLISQSGWLEQDSVPSACPEMGSHVCTSVYELCAGKRRANRVSVIHGTRQGITNLIIHNQTLLFLQSLDQIVKFVCLGFTPYQQYFSYFTTTVHKFRFPELFLTST